MINLSSVFGSKAYKINTFSSLVFVGLFVGAQASQAATTINSNGFNTAARTYVTVGDTLNFRSTNLSGGIYTQGSQAILAQPDIARQLLVFDYDKALVQNTGSLKLTFTFNYELNSGVSARNLTFWDVSDDLADSAATLASAGVNGSSENVGGSFQDLNSCSGSNCKPYARYTMPNNQTTTTFTATVYLNQAAIDKLKATGRFAIGVDPSLSGNALDALAGRISNAQLVAAVPLPPAALLFGPAVLAVGAVRRKQLLNKVASV